MRKKNQQQQEVTLRPNYADTFVIDDTRIWEHIFPDKRTSFPTEHERCHSVGLRMLAILVSILEKHNLKTYFVTHGTLLGAARHGSFIPHDVDVDIAMPSGHMNVLRRIWRSEMPRDMFLQSDGTEPNFYMWSTRRSAMRVKDRYSCSFGVPTTIVQGKRKIKLKPTHDGFGIDIIPLEKRMRGKQYKILHHYFNTSDIFPLSTVCFGGVLVPAPRRVDVFLKTLYGPDYLKNEHVLPAHFGGPEIYPCLATLPCPGTKWSLNWTADRQEGNRCKLWPRDDPNTHT